MPDRPWYVHTSLPHVWLVALGRAVIRRKYLENAEIFHRKVAEGTEPWVKTRTPDDAGASHTVHVRLVTKVGLG